jgi:FAD/FMN-containing dehydrogenase
MKINGWGNYPTIISEVESTSDFSKIQELISKNNELIPTGLLRSYGDSALADITFSTLKLNKFLKFDQANGIMITEAGVSFAEINEVTIPSGWFLPVTPGTKFVTVGGAIASDVHGKNHHKNGTFGNFVNWMKIMVADGSIVLCSKYENPDLYYATIGGMGLTGIILETEFSLQKIETSTIQQKTIKAKNLDELLNLFEQYAGYTYSVAWLDTAAKGNNSGRALLYVGEHSSDKEFDLHYGHQKQIINLPFFLPNSLLNQISLRTLILAYYSKEFKRERDFQTNFDTFFYPLDAINNWNRGYGKRGFSQYQFVIPIENASIHLKKVLNTLSDYGQTSFLTVLKVFGEENENYLSFPQKGYTLAMDFAISRKSLDMFNALDKIVDSAGGRLYLTKDARMSNEFFTKRYPNLNKFREIKAKWDPNNKFQSLQSKRLGI